MELKLRIDGKLKTFKQAANMPAIRFKQSIALASQFEVNPSEELLERIVEFISNDLYDSKFTPEEFWGGLNVDELLKVVMEQLASPMHRSRAYFEQLKN
ncbi:MULTISPECIES: phage tail assembly chaperone G [Bacillus cereus group]|uniref:phage tail assembly chaperone G n=1 Tax=Bacillus cereus group TaxID=86661 RepID=UPI000BEF6D65|nr:MULTISPECIES: hypothetical protein [Bacillus cereus group]PEO38296.1 hypothetical protein CN555_13890 [Bacillus wiedmannii]HDR7275048.1 hypothetical protein [Bacillus paranthracis]HDR7304499.1 hypothetical protein [Bacillus paranthracis]